jgi:hypothetical protein
MGCFDCLTIASFVLAIIAAVWERGNDPAFEGDKLGYKS